MEFKVNYFDCKFQTTEEETVRLVCYSPPERKVLQTAPLKKRSPIKIQANRNTKKRLNTDSDEYTIPKNAKVVPSNIEFSYDEAIDDHLHFVKEVLEANVYTSVDLKVKIITKGQNKQLIVKNTKTTYKCDTIVADDTDSMKLVLWEDLSDKVFTGRCYHFTNLTVRIFDDVKFVNTNELSVVKEIEEIPNVKMDAPDIKDNLVMGQVVGVNIKRSPSCMACNETLSRPEDEEEDITCKNCNFTTLIAIFVQHKISCSVSHQNTKRTINLNMLQ